jgi:TP901 family phage tail tape measure protein
MATFNLTAQLNLKGPTNVKQIAAQIKKDLGTLNANVQFKLDPAASKNVAALSSSLKVLNANFASTVKSANAATSAIKAFGNSVNSVKINNVPQQINQTSSAIAKLNKVSSSTSGGLQNAATEMQEFGKQAGLAVRRFVAFSAVTSVIYGVTNSINNGIQAFIDYDKELVKLQQVTGESAAGLSKLQSQITNLAVEFGVSSKELTQVASTLAQAGLSARETEKALKALALSSLAPSFDNMNETVEGSIAIMRQFGISANDLEASLGAVNAVAARFAVESSDIITAVQRTGSVFATASKGVSEGKDALNEFISVFTSIRATSRESAETIATGLRTIFTRVQRGTTIDALKEFGVNLTDTEGKFVGAYKAVELLSKGLGKIDPRSLDFSRIVEELGGFRQIGKVIPLIQQFTVTQQALKVAQQGQASLAKDAATAQLSLANQISKVREEFFSLFREIGQSKGFQSLVRGALSLTSGLIKVADAVKGILPALAVLAAFKGFKALTEFTTGFTTGVKRGPDGKANGGVIRKFARGGVVPGTGSGDTVPAMLEPGEFVIRKKAVETIGSDNLHNMNKYGGGGSIRAGKSNKRQRFGGGGKAPEPLNVVVDHVYDGDSPVVKFTPKTSAYDTSSRLVGVDTFEMRSNQKWKKNLALEAKKLTETQYTKGKNVTENFTKGYSQQTDKERSGRPLFVDDNLKQNLIDKGLGFSYSGTGPKRAETITKAEYLSLPEGKQNKRLIEQDPKKFDKKNLGGRIQRFMAGGKAESTPFGTGQTKFPKRITNAYVKEMEKKLNDEQVSLAWDQYPKDERINVDQNAVAEHFKSQAFDRKKFESLFKTKIRRNDLVGDLANFAKYIGLPEQDLSKVLPQNIDFGGVGQNVSSRGTFYANPYGARDFDKLDLSQYGFTTADEQDLYGYQKLWEEKEKEIKKIMKTPTKTFDDGSFSIDDAAFKKAYDEKSALTMQISKVKDKQAYARKAAMAAKKEITETTGRGTVGLSSTRYFPNQEKNTLYHELTHQLLNSIRTQSSGAFDQYRNRVSQLFSGDNDGLADAFDALTEKDGGYNSADVVYGRSYKNNMLNSVLSNLRRDTIRTGRSDNPEVSKEGSALYFEAEKKKNAREYRPINPKITDLLLKGGVKQDVINKAEDNGKEEFLTTLIQKRPMLDSNMEGILDSTLNELLGSAGIQRQQYTDGGKVTRNLGYIDFDVINDPANAQVIEQAMKKAGVDGPRNYTEYLTDLAIKARKEKSLNSLKALYGVAGAGKSSIVTGRGSNDNGTLRQTNRFPILTPEDITKASEVMLLTSTVSQDKLEGMLQEVDRAYTLSSTTKEEKDRILKQRTMRDVSGVGLFGRTAGSTTGAPLDTAKEEALLEDRIGSKSVVLGRKDDGGLRRKTGNELVEATKKKIGLTWGGFAPTTVGHESMMEAAKAAGIPYEDFIALVGSDEAVDSENYRTAVFDKDFRLALAKAGFGSKGASVLPKAFGDMSVPLAFDMGEKDGRRQITLAGEGSMAFVADKTEKQMEKYKKAGYGVSNLKRTGGISGTQVRDLVLNGNLEGLQQVVSPSVFSLLKNNMVQLQNRSNVLPTLIEQAEAAYKEEVSGIDQQLAATGITRADNKKAETDKEYAAQLELYRSLKDKKKKLETKKSFEPYRLLRQLATSDPAKYGLRFDTDSSSSPTGPSSAIQQAILAKVATETAVKKSSGILPAQGTEILKRFGSERLPNDSSFGPFSGKTVSDTAEGGKLKYWNSAFRPETKADKLAYYTRTRDYLIDKFKQSQGTQKATALKDTTNAVLSSTQLGLVGLNPLGYTGLLGPETWNLGTDSSGKDRSINASIVQRGLPTEFQNVIDYLSGQTAEIVQGASKLLGITPKELTKKQRETLGQGNIEGALLEQIFGSADATILDDALRTRPIDFPMGIGPKAAKIFGIDPNIPTEVKRTIDSNSRGKAVEEFQKYFRAQYGIPEPKNDKMVQKLSGGGLLKKYGEIFPNNNSTGPFKEMVFDFDDTLVTGGEIRLPDGKLDLSRKDDMPLVQEMLKKGKLTPLGQHLSEALKQEPSLIDNVSILSARNPNQTGILAQTLQNLGLPIPESKIRGSNGPQNKKITGYQKMIDDNLETIMRLKGQGHEAIHYTFAKGGKVEEEYKSILASILPKEMLTSDGYLKMPSGQAEPIDFIPGRSLAEKSKSSVMSILLGKSEKAPPEEQTGAFYQGGLMPKVLRHNLEKYKSKLPEDEYKALKQFVDQRILFEGNDDTIKTAGGLHKGVLAHESFHDIQGHLYDNHPEIIDKLHESLLKRKDAVEKWYKDPKNAEWAGPKDYRLEHFFPTATSKSPYSGNFIAEAHDSVKKITKKNNVSQNLFSTLGATQWDLGKNELIPVLLSAAVENNKGAIELLSQAFGESGLNPDFYKTLPKYADGGMALGLEDTDMSSLISSMYGSADSIARTFQGAGLTAGMPERSIGAAGVTGLQKSQEKKPKNYSKIGLRSDGSEITATYFKNNDRQGFVSAKKATGNLFTVGLSKATQGYGPRLYDIVMEAATAAGSMLTSDRNQVSESAKSVWSYYFNNRSDVKKTPLDPSQWTKNHSYLDPKLYGRKETWPPPSDPAWILQSGYNKSADLINSPDVINMNDPKYAEHIKAQQLSFLSRNGGGSIRKFASGGNTGLSSEDTVPALLTPGEFVVNKNAAKKIGYNKLHQLNKADKIQGYNKGGIVGGVQKFAFGGGVDSVLSGLQNITSYLGKTQNITSNRPNSIDTSTIAVDPSILQDTKAFVDTLYDAGDGMKYLNRLLNENKQLSIKAVLDAGNKDLERLKISGASIDKIIEAEKALSNIRNKGLIDVTKRQFLESGFKESSVGKKLGSGATQQKILSLAEKEEQRLIDKRKKAIEADIVSSSKQPIAASDLADQVAQAISSELNDIKTQAFSRATTVATGTQTSTGIKGNITASELKNLNISGNDIQKYISDSMRDRKTLRQMDQQLIATRMEEYKNAGTIRGISVASAEEAKKLAQEEVSKRREAINDLAKMRGERGVGAAGLMDTRNSPINRAFRERYFTGNLGRSMQRGLGDVGLAAGLVAGQGQNISSALFDTKTDKGKIKAADAGARIDKAATTLSVGLTTSAQLAAINPMLGAAAAIGTALYAGADAAFDFSGTAKKAAQEMTRSLLNDKLSAASDSLSNALEKLSKDVNNVDLRAKTASSVKALTDTAIESTADTATAGKNKAENDRNWTDFGRGILLGIGEIGVGMNPYYQDLDPVTVAKSKKGSYGTEEASVDAQKELENYQKIANTGYGDLERLYSKGFSNDQIMDPSNEAGNIVRESLKGMILSDPKKLALYMSAGEQGKETIVGKAAQDEFLANDELAKASQESAKLARAMDLADKAGRRLAASFDKIADIVNESVNKISFESDARVEATTQYASSLRGESKVSGPKLREKNILDNPNAYSEEEFTKALESATAGLDAGIRKQLIGGAQLQQNIPKNITQSIATVLDKSAGSGVDELKKAAVDTAKNEIENNPNLSRQQKDELKQISTAKIENMAKKAKENNADNTMQVSEFRKELEDGTNILGDFGKKLLDSVKNLSSFKEGALDKFAKGLNEASKAAKEAQNYFRKSRDISNEGNMNLREILSGYGETYNEKSNRIMGDVSNLAGGETTVQGIQNRQIRLSQQRDTLQKQQGTLTDKDALRNNVEQLNKLDDQLQNNREALDMLANSTELVDKAFSDLQHTSELQNNRQNFVNQLLTNTPEEADKLNQSFIRLQRNLSGGLNSPYNQRDARKAFNEALFKTGNVREATRAGNTVLANQRKETLALSQDPGVKAAQELQIRNQYAQNQGKPGVDVDQAVAEYFQKQQLQLTKQMAIESGMANNPLVQQSLAALQDRKTDPSMQKAAERYLESVGLRSSATKGQGELAESQSILKDSNDNLRISIDDLRASVEGNMKDANIGKDAAGNNIVNPGVAVAAPPVARSSGGLIYASNGKLIDFKPKGTDTVPAMLSPGEFVINSKSTQKHLPLLQSINSGYFDKVGLVSDFTQFDKNKNNLLDKKEFTKYFSDFDLNKDDAIDMKEFKLGMGKQYSRRKSLWLKGSKSRTEEEETEYQNLRSLHKTTKSSGINTRKEMLDRAKGQIRYERQQAYLSRFRPEIRERKEKSLLKSGMLYYPDGTSPRGKMFKMEGSRSTQNVADLILPPPYKNVPNTINPNTELLLPNPSGGMLNSSSGQLAKTQTNQQMAAVTKPTISTTTGKYPKADGTTGDDIGDADFSKFATKDWVTLANDPNNTAAMARQIAQQKLFTMGLDKDGKPLNTSSGTSPVNTTKSQPVNTQEPLSPTTTQPTANQEAQTAAVAQQATSSRTATAQESARKVQFAIDEGKKIIDVYRQHSQEEGISDKEREKRLQQLRHAQVEFGSTGRASAGSNPIGLGRGVNKPDGERWAGESYKNAEDYFEAKKAGDLFKKYGADKPKLFGSELFDSTLPPEMVGSDRTKRTKERDAAVSDFMSGLLDYATGFKLDGSERHTSGTEIAADGKNVARLSARDRFEASRETSKETKTKTKLTKADAVSLGVDPMLAGPLTDAEILPPLDSQTTNPLWKDSGGVPPIIFSQGGTGALSVQTLDRIQKDQDLQEMIQKHGPIQYADKNGNVLFSDGTNYLRTSEPGDVTAIGVTAASMLTPVGVVTAGASLRKVPDIAGRVMKRESTPQDAIDLIQITSGIVSMANSARTAEQLSGRGQGILGGQKSQRQRATEQAKAESAIDRDMKQALDESRYNITEKLNDAEEARLWESIDQQTRKAGKSVVESVKKTAMSAQPMRGTEYGFGGGDSATLNARAAKAMEPEMLDLKSSGRTTSGQYKLTSQGEKFLAKRIVEFVEKSKNNAEVTPGLKPRGNFMPDVLDEGVGIGGQINIKLADDAFALNHEGFHAASDAIGALEDAGLLTPGVVKNLPKEYAPLVSGAADRARSFDEYIRARQATRGTSKPIEPSIVESMQKAFVEEEAAVSASLRQKPTDNPSYNRALKQYNRTMGYADDQPFQTQTPKSMLGSAVNFAKKYGTTGALAGLAADSIGRLFGSQSKDQAKVRKPARRASGGLIYAENGQLIDFSPKGTDTVPAMLTPGEFVVNAKSTKENLGLLHSINKSKGGKINYLADGGKAGTNIDKDEDLNKDGIITDEERQIYQSQKEERQIYQRQKELYLTRPFGQMDDRQAYLTRPFGYSKGGPVNYLAKGGKSDKEQRSNDALSSYDSAGVLGQMTERFMGEQLEADRLASGTAQFMGGASGADVTAGLHYQRNYGERAGEKPVSEARTESMVGNYFDQSKEYYDNQGRTLLNLPERAAIFMGQGLAHVVLPESELEPTTTLTYADGTKFREGPAEVGTGALANQAAMVAGVGALGGARIGAGFSNLGKVADPIGAATEVGLTHVDQAAQGVRRLAGSAVEGIGKGIGSETMAQTGRAIQITSGDAAIAAARIASETAVPHGMSPRDAAFAHMGSETTDIHSGTSGDWHLDPNNKFRNTGNLGASEPIPQSAMRDAAIARMAENASDINRGGAGHGSVGSFHHDAPQVPVIYARDSYVATGGEAYVVKSKVDKSLIDNSKSLFDDSLTSQLSNELLPNQSAAPVLHPGRSAPADMVTGADVVTKFSEQTFKPAKEIAQMTPDEQMAYAAQREIAKKQVENALKKSSPITKMKNSQVESRFADMPGTTRVVHDPMVLGPRKSYSLRDYSRIGQTHSPLYVPDLGNHVATHAYKTGLEQHDEKAKDHSSGGLIYANNGALIGASGTDNVPAMLTPGEFVVNRESSQKHMPILNAINSGHFNRGGIVNYLANGGIAGPKYLAAGGTSQLAQLAPISNAGQTLKQTASSSGGVSNNVSIDTANIASSIQDAVTNAIGQFNEYTEQIGANFTEQFNSAQKSLSSSIDTFQTATAQFGEHANAIPTSLSANVTQTTSLHHIGLDSIKGNMEQKIYDQTSINAKNISQDSHMQYDKTVFEGGMNSAAKQSIIGRTA